MKTSKLLKTFVVFCFTLWMGLCCHGQEGAKQQTEAEKYYQRMINKQSIKEYAKGEHFCWRAASGMDRFVNNFTATKDGDWIKEGIKYCDFLLDRMDTARTGTRAG